MLNKSINYIEEQSDSMLSNSHLFLRRNMSIKEFNKLLLKQTDYSYLKDLKFAVEQYKKDNKGVLFEDFCEYILPPFIYNEEIEDWRSQCYNEFNPIVLNSNIYEVCDTLNKIIGKKFIFKNIGKHQYKNWSSFLKKKEGSCLDMSQIVLYPIRSLGYAATIDYVVAWGNTNGSHSWNVVLNSGVWKPFMGLEHEIGFRPFFVWEYKPDITKSGYKYPPKIFRRTFSINQEYLEISKQIKKGQQSSRLFSDLRFKDVTSEYFHTYNIILHCKDEIKKNVLFLNVFNNGKWEPIAATLSTKNNAFSFKNMKSDMLYLASNPEVLENKSVPFILYEYGKIEFLVPNRNKSEFLDIEFLYPRIQEYLNAFKIVDWSCPEKTFNEIAEDKNRICPQNGIDYHLYYYESGWKKLVTSKSQHKILHFENLPASTLFILKDNKGIIEGRPFTIKNGKCQWW